MYTISNKLDHTIHSKIVSYSYSYNVSHTAVEQAAMQVLPGGHQVQSQ